jgi:hypothetical protein
MKLRSLYYAGILLVLLLFPYGPLFPWSPVKPGFEHIALDRADVYYPTGTTLDPAYLRADSIIRESESFHRLAAPKRICIVACKDWDDFARRLPQFRGSRGIGAVTLATGTVIYVAPSLKERGKDVGEYLRHEVSHATLHQNQSIMNAYRLTEVQWLSEGIAVSYGNQKSYYSDAEFQARIQRENVAPFIDPARRGEVKELFEMRYAYVAWRRFNEYLIASRGRDVYQGYLTAVMRDPRAWRELFPKHFQGLSFAQAIEEFQRSARR